MLTDGDRVIHLSVEVEPVPGNIFYDFSLSIEVKSGEWLSDLIIGGYLWINRANDLINRVITLAFAIKSNYCRCQVFVTFFVLMNHTYISE